MQQVTIVGSGAMGSGVARRLAENGVRVATLLDGRSAASRRRAEEAGMTPVDAARAVQSGAILSIVPPAAALEVAERLRPALSQAMEKPVFVDCNAISPATARAAAEIVGRSGAPFVDASIIGGPPKPGASGPAFYASGEAAPRFASLRERGLDVRVLDGPVGAASALKMCYAGITKGLTALGTAMILAASRDGAAEALRRELELSQPHLLSFLTRSVPGMFPKAYRWVAEMEEIADFAGADPASKRIYEAAARLFEEMALDVDGANEKTAALTRFFG
jgi:3-hydroxyisobutyrate dehydrogenase-like beta-hydroxyacid dehydrogenase